jgi:hypothetical protein
VCEYGLDTMGTGARGDACGIHTSGARGDFCGVRIAGARGGVDGICIVGVGVKSTAFVPSFSAGCMACRLAY